MSLCAVCSVGSVAGALLGYAIGAFLYETIRKWLIDLYSYDERVDQFRALYAQWAAQSFSLSNRSGHLRIAAWATLGGMVS